MGFRVLRIMTILAFLSIRVNTYAQVYEVNKENSEMKIAGTSTLHDWHSEVNEIDGEANIIIEGDVVKEVKGLEISVQVSSIKSGKNGMDKNAREALKESDFPEIQFTLTRIGGITNTEIQSFGLLTIAGATREVEMYVNYDITGSDLIEFIGEIDLQMTDFEVDPPSALLGTVKTGDPVTISYKVTFRKT